MPYQWTAGKNVAATYRSGVTGNVDALEGNFVAVTIFLVALIFNTTRRNLKIPSPRFKKIDKNINVLVWCNETRQSTLLRNDDVIKTER